MQFFSLHARTNDKISFKKRDFLSIFSTKKSKKLILLKKQILTTFWRFLKTSYVSFFYTEAPKK